MGTSEDNEHELTDRRRTEQALCDESRVLELLNETGTVLASQLELPRLAQAVTDATTALSSAAFGVLFYTMKSAGDALWWRCTMSGAHEAVFDDPGDPTTVPLFAPTFRGEGVVRYHDLTEDPRHGTIASYRGALAGFGSARSYLAIPVISRSGSVIGGLFFGHPEPGVFTPRTERIIAGVAAHAAVAIDNAQLFDDIRRVSEDRAALLEAERQSRAELERVSLMKDEFLATLSHELRTPLNAVLGWSEILLEGVADPAALKRGLETIARNARVQAQLIEDLLDMSRIVSGKVRLDVQRTNLGHVVDAALDAVKPSMDAKSIRLAKVVDPLAGPVYGDPNRLQQIVWNLLSNAVKFTPRGGRVQVVIARANSQIEITVSDSGPGISPEFLPHVFERFRQADASITRKHGGLGLGLAIVKQLVELHGGTIRADNAGPGGGAVFVVCLPLGAIRDDDGRREHPTTGRMKPLARVVSLEGIKVLVIDDEPDARELIKWVLESSQAEVATAGSAAEGLDLVKTLRPDLVISDIGMPEKDGYQLIREIRSLPPDQGGRIPAIALTAFARSEDRTRTLLAGYQIHLAKPIEPRELVATVGSLVGRTAASG